MFSGSMLTTADAAKRAGMSYNHFLALRGRGETPPPDARIGSSALYKADTIDRWMQVRGKKTHKVGMQADVSALVGAVQDFQQAHGRMPTPEDSTVTLTASWGDVLAILGRYGVPAGALTQTAA